MRSPKKNGDSVNHQDLWENAALSYLECGKSASEAVSVADEIVNALEDRLAKAKEEQAASQEEFAKLVDEAKELWSRLPDIGSDAAQARGADFAQAGDLGNLGDAGLGNGAYMAQPDSVSEEEVQAAQQRQGSARQSWLQRNGSNIASASILTVVIVAFLMFITHRDPPTPEPAAWTGERVEREISHLSKAAAWAKKQGLPLLGVRCENSGCSANTIGATYHLECFGDECKIRAISFPSQYQNHYSGTGTP